MDETDQESMKRVAVDPKVCGGKPFLRGTHVSVAVILDALTQGLSADEIVECYPALEREDVEAAWSFAMRLAEENGGIALVGRPVSESLLLPR